MSKTFALKDVCETIVDCEHKTAPEDREGRFFAVGTPAMKGNRIDYSQARTIDEDTFNKWTRRLSPAVGDLLLAREAPVGPIVRIPNELNVAPGQRTVLVRPDLNVVDATYLYYLLSSPDQQAALQRNAEGSTVPHLNVSDVRNFVLPKLPGLIQQIAIAEVLGALDDKIAANERVVLLNSRLTNALYKSAPKSKTKPLSSVASFVNGRAFTKNATGTGRVVIRIAELNSGVGPSTVLNDIRVDEKNLARPGDLLFAWSGSLTVARWYEPEAIVNQHIFKVESIDGSPLWLVRELLNEKLDGFKAIAADKATTMGHIKRSHLDEPVLLPEDSWLHSQGAVMTGFWELELELELENRRLTHTRDELLPLLMSGKLAVKDAEKVVSEAV